MVDPEDRLEEEILNGVALRPRVNSETDTEIYTLICVLIVCRPKKGPAVHMHLHA